MVYPRVEYDDGAFWHHRVAISGVGMRNDDDQIFGAVGSLEGGSRDTGAACKNEIRVYTRRKLTTEKINI